MQILYPPLEIETVRYFTDAYASGTPPVYDQFTADSYVKTIKRGGSVTFSGQNLFLSMGSANPFIYSSPAGIDLRVFAYGGWKFSFTDTGSRVSTAYGNGVVSGGEQLSAELLTTWSNATPSWNVFDISGSTIVHGVEGTGGTYGTSAGDGAYGTSNVFSDSTAYGLYKFVQSGTVLNNWGTTYKPTIQIRSVSAPTQLDTMNNASYGTITGTFYCTATKSASSGYRSGIYLFTGGKFIDFSNMSCSMKRVIAPTETGVLLSSPNVPASFVFSSTGTSSTFTLKITRS